MQCQQMQRQSSILWQQGSCNHDDTAHRDETDLLGEAEVGLEEGFDGSNVLPVVVEEVGHDSAAGGRLRNDLSAKVVELGLLAEQLEHQLLLEHVDAH